MGKSKKLTPEEIHQIRIEQCNKSEALENALINEGIEGIRACFAEKGKIDFTARMLGIACRYYGLEYVKALVECGADFEFKFSNEISNKFRCNTFSGTIRSDFSLMLLGDVENALSGLCITRGVLLKKELTFTNGNKRDMISFAERLKIVKYLDENSANSTNAAGTGAHGTGKANFDKNMLYYYSILADDNEMRTALKDMGAALPDNVKTALTVGDTKGIWQRFCETADKMTDKQFINVVNNLSGELGGVMFYYSDYFTKYARSRLRSAETFEIVLERFNNSKMNQLQIMKMLILKDNVTALELAEKQGWIKQPKKRDEMIDFAVENKKTECAAYLLDFKNRTADLAAEREKAEKKEERELNAAPDSVTALKKIWGYKKRKDGTIVITSYKGTSTAPVVPQYIGKSKVTAVGGDAFSPKASRITRETAETRRAITSVTLPDGIEFIGDGAFCECKNLETVNFPDAINFIGKYAFDSCKKLKSIIIPCGVNELSYRTFAECSSLKSVVIPQNITNLKGNVFVQCTSLEHIEIRGRVEEIPAHFFVGCSSLKSFVIPEGVTKIGYFAFSECTSLETVTFPKSLKTLETQAFSGCKKLKAVEIPSDLNAFIDVSFKNCTALEEIKLTGRVPLLRLCLREPITKRFEISEGLERIELTDLKELHLASESVTLPRSLKKVGTILLTNHEYSGEEITPTAIFHVPDGSYAEEFCRKKGYRIFV